MKTKRTKRQISGIMALCMAFSLFAGCQKNVDEDMVLPPPPDTEATETTPEMTEAPTETTTEITTPEETDTLPEESTEETTNETTAEETTETTSAETWSETEMTAVMYITENCYSRERAIIGSTPISQHYIGDSVEVVAITDTGYYKLAAGGFIHSDYVSENKPVVTTAAPATAAPSTDSSSASVTAAPTVTPDVGQNTAAPFVNPGSISTGNYNISPSSRYAYKQLTAAEQTLYNDIVSAAYSFDSAVAIPSGMSKDDVVKVYAIVSNNEPQLFWLGTSVSAGTSFATISFKTTDPSEIASMQAEIDSAAANVLSKASGYSGTISKLKVFYDYIVLNSDFSKSEGGYNGSIYNGLTGKGNLQCAGYAKTMQYLCDMAGIECCVVAGTNSEGDSHAWNVVYCQNGYYNIDATWGDPINDFDSSYVQYEFFLVPDSWIHNITHYNVSTLIRSNGNSVRMYDPPACTKEGCNYFAAYNKIYSSYAEADAALKAEFDAQIAAGNNVVELRVTDKSVYDQMMTDDAYRTYQKYAKSKSGKVARIQRQKSLTGGVQVVHYDVIYS
ncbi:MAG: hypothetical protein K2K57_01290 [Oscillospiraceae bacterium]|nr:hypothetical protein [Oscillospiraceae bacterium]